jgi:hypothetical protein
MKKYIIISFYLLANLLIANSKFIYIGGNINIVNNWSNSSLKRIKFISPNINIGYGKNIKLNTNDLYLGYNFEFGQQTFMIGYGPADAPRSNAIEIRQNYISGILEFGKKFILSSEKNKILLAINTEIKFLTSDPYAQYSDPTFSVISSVYEKLQTATPIQFLIGCVFGLENYNFNFKLFINYCINGINKYYDAEPYRYLNIKIIFGFKL